ncbi:MMPL family transporter [Phycicoccus flavus]|uniref:MMPL family transporter n=1 Tax=Phycicoccus flavus TaxID=2502783 RepID=UPI000FEBD92B|nr:MMPL family transporter [Phycicoccus flavus]NHA69796.1 MMPL family transporter [Phycicoccus flavus]
MERWTAWVLRHRLLVVVVWAAVAVAGGVTAPRTVERLTYDFALPGLPAYETNTTITERFGTGGADDPLLLVVRGADAEGSAARVARQVRRAVPGTRTVTAEDAGAASLTTRDGSVSVVVVSPPVTPGPEPYAASLPALQRLAAEARDGGVDATLTGFTQLTEGSGGDRGVLVEVLLGGAGALVVLALVFGSLLAGVPLLVAAVSILGTFLALLGLTGVTDVSFVVQYLVALIGLGVAIDYTLLVVTRWREEREDGAEDREAVRTAMATSGRAVVFSGTTVAVSLAALVLVPLPFLRSIGLGGLLIPLFSVATSLSLLPVLLDTLGPRMLWPHRRRARTRSRRWAAVAGTVLRHRVLTIVGSGALLLALALPSLGLTLGSPQLSGLRSGSPASTAVSAAVDGGVPVGALRPSEILVDAADAEADLGRIRALEGVAGAVSPTGDGWTAGGDRLVQVWSAADPSSDAGRATLDRLRAWAAQHDARVGGSPAEDADFVLAVYRDAPWILGGVVVVTFLLLARALRSVWLPVKALVLNVLSVAAAYGVTVLVWQDGWGTRLLFDQTATGVVTTWVPIAGFAFLFGLSMDYEVFILARMREAYDAHGDTDRAVVDGIAHTGRLVTSAALILFLAFVALSTVPTVDVKILATTLALGIAIDAVVVRSLLAPALVAALGRLNWTMPDILARLLRA